MEQQRIEKIEERLEKLERTRGEAEPIKVTRIEIDTGDVRERFDRINKRQADTEQTLDNHTTVLKEMSTEQDAQSKLLQTIFNMVGTQNTDIGVLKHEMQGARADITAIKATQSDHGELFKEHREILKSHSQRFDKLEATQDEHSELLIGQGKKLDKLEATQDEQGQKLDLILQLLQKQG